MASSMVASRLSSRLRPIALLKLHKGNSLSLDAPLLKSVSPSRSSAARRISRSSRHLDAFMTAYFQKDITGVTLFQIGIR
ncbi:uncharacterized protein LOC131336396 isoform X2 [Rhododendron vialii]|uniref:uncharacterized protein LOC131336396 isoform X2 n=1 Tax=Rhododendron vialii TaxID=182163 RepID=UPI00265F3713|nr:uncharacterized protein LOC131336396 isoform X2 [Rhododendron vialii]